MDLGISAGAVGSALGSERESLADGEDWAMSSIIGRDIGAHAAPGLIGLAERNAIESDCAIEVVMLVEAAAQGTKERGFARAGLADDEAGLRV